MEARNTDPYAQDAGYVYKVYSDYFTVKERPPGTYFVSGKVTRNNNPLTGITLSFAGKTTQTGQDGTYLFSNVGENTAGSITPVDADCIFSPASIPVSSLTADVDGKDFEAECSDYLTTVVRTEQYDGTPISGVAVKLQGMASVTSDENGNCTVELPSGWSGFANATKTGFSFETKDVRTITGIQTIILTGRVYPATGLNASARVRRLDWDTIYSEQNGESCDKCEGLTGDPVDISTGAQILKDKLLTVQGLIPVTFSLTYNSLILDDGPAGKGWGFNYGFGAHLEKLSDSAVEVHWTSNRSNRFSADSDNIFRCADPGKQYDELVKNADGTFTLVLEDNVMYRFNGAGSLVKLFNEKGQVLVFSYNTQGRISKITEPVSGVFLSYAYNDDGLLASVSDPMGRKVSLAYNAKKHLTGITNADGQTTTYTYNDKGQTLSAVNADGEQLFRNTYDDQGRIIAQDDGIDTNKPIRFSYEEDETTGKIITTITNRNGDSRVYTFNSDYQMLNKKDELGNISALYTYDDKGNRTSATDANGHTTYFSYDTHGNMTSVTDTQGNVTRMNYDDADNLSATINAMGKRASFAYDGRRNLTRATDVQGNATQYTYNDNGQVASVTSPEGHVTTFAYENGRLVRVIAPEGNDSRMAYDAAGRLIQSEDAGGNAVSITYDASCAGSCRAVTMTDPLGHTVHRTYDSRNNLISVTDPKGNETRFEYDGEGNMFRTVNALEQETRYEYDGEGRVVRITDANGNATRFEYDAKGRMVRVIDALGNTREVAYDKTRNPVQEKDAFGNVVSKISYNDLDMPVSVTDTLGRTAKFDYDKLSRLTRTIDPLNRATRFTYDDLNRMTGSVDALGGQSSQAFDKEGNRTSITDPVGNQTRFGFDGNGRLVSEALETGDTVRYTYNARDLLAQITNGRGQNRTFEYDTAGRLTKMTDPDGTISYAYDANSNVLTVTDESGVISREYDQLNRVVKYTGAQGDVIQYQYDAVGNLAALIYPDGKTVRYGYDALNRMVSVTDWAGRKTSYAYDKNSRLVRTERPNGTVMTRTYNDAGQLLQQVDATGDGVLIVRYDFTYDAAGNIVEEKATPANDCAPVEPAEMTYGDSNRLATFNGDAVQFDADGNMIHGPLNGAMADFLFDSRNRLRQAGTTKYVYDAENHRLAVDESGKQTGYMVNPNAALSQVLIRTEADGTETYYVYGLGLIGQDAGNAYQTYHFDLRGSTVALSDSAGTISDKFKYTPYAELAEHTGTSDTPFRYNGRDGVMTDADGLYYMRARFYEPSIKRFVNQDILLGNVADGLSLNRYAYVKGMPISFIDPFGLVSLDPNDPEVGVTIADWIQKLYNAKTSLIEEVIKNSDGLIYFKVLTKPIDLLFSGIKVALAPDKEKQIAIEAGSTFGAAICAATGVGLIGSAICGEVGGEIGGWTMDNHREQSYQYNTRYDIAEQCYNQANKRAIDAMLDYNSNFDMFSDYNGCVDEKHVDYNLESFRAGPEKAMENCLYKGRSDCFRVFKDRPFMNRFIY